MTNKANSISDMSLHNDISSNLGNLNRKFELWFRRNNQERKVEERSSSIIDVYEKMRQHFQEIKGHLAI